VEVFTTLTERHGGLTGVAGAFADMDGHKPKIGLLLLSAEWFQQIGATQGSFAHLSGFIESDALRIRSTMEPHFQIIGGEVLVSRQQVVETVRHFLLEEVEGVVVCNITWGEDRLLIDAVEHLKGTPLLLWCYTPFERLPESMNMNDLLRSSGAVGAVQASAPLKRLGLNPIFTVGSCSSKRAIADILCFGRAAKVIRDLKSLRIGVLPYRCDQMTGTYVDEFRLKKELGPELVYISVNEYKEACDEISTEQVLDFITYLRNKYRVRQDIRDLDLSRSARASLGLAAIAAQRGLGALALEDVSPELHRVIGLRPCLVRPGLAEDFVVSMEADVCGAISLWVLRAFTGHPAMYSEIFTFDENDNSVLIGHAGFHDIQLANSSSEIYIEPDGEYLEMEPEACWMRFRVKPGPVTLLSIFCDVEKFKLVFAEGESISGGPKLLGPPYTCVRLKRPVGDFLENCLRTGMTQHWGLVHGDVINEVVALGRLLDLQTVSV